MKSEEKAIEEMAKVLKRACEKECISPVDCDLCKAASLYNAGYRKQSENVVELPCKVGDTLYVISQMKDKRILPFINQYEVTSIAIKKKSIVVYHEMDGYIKVFTHTNFGKTVFLTQEEAEAKMKGGE